MLPPLGGRGRFASRKEGGRLASGAEVGFPPERYVTRDNDHGAGPPRIAPALVHPVRPFSELVPTQYSAEYGLLTKSG